MCTLHLQVNAYISMSSILFQNICFLRKKKWIFLEIRSHLEGSIGFLFLVVVGYLLILIPLLLWFINKLGSSGLHENMLDHLEIFFFVCLFVLISRLCLCVNDRN